jgi:ABC-type phosphate/phosphonate transport system substrate-binding protein
MSRRDETVIVGCVAYHPRIVTIWEGFVPYFAEHGAPTDYVLYSNYERQVEALLAGEIDIGWNTNTAYVVAEARIGGDAQVLGMRDVDADFRTVLVARQGEGFEEPRALAGRRLAIATRDSGHAAILPLHYLARAGLDAARECELVRFDTDLGKHGDTGDSELRVLRAVRDGEADAGALGDSTWALLTTQSPENTEGLEVWWRSPTYFHCNFTALPSFEGGGRWSDVLLAMRYDDPSVRVEMDLEGLKRWLPGDKSGYADLTKAMREQGYIA